eukprot:73558-Amphidinium_carterae.1
MICKDRVKQVRQLQGTHTSNEYSAPPTTALASTRQAGSNATSNQALPRFETRSLNGVHKICELCLANPFQVVLSGLKLREFCTWQSTCASLSMHFAWPP